MSTGLRRKLLIYSTPVVLMVAVLIAKLLSVGVAGDAAVQNFSAADTSALSQDVDVLAMINIIEPAKAHFAAGALAVLRGRLDDAERAFARALDTTDQDESCPVRVNLELVRESRADNAAAMFDAPTAVGYYRAARQVVEQAPAGCFAGDEVLSRLDAKIAAVTAPPPPPPPAPPPVSAPAAPAPDSGTAPERELMLEPGAGDPLDKLLQILRDAAG